MRDFSNYLVSKHFTSKKESHIYQLWVKRLYEFTGKSPGSNVKKQDINYYINNITKFKNGMASQAGPRGNAPLFGFLKTGLIMPL
jgi:hypothetical protein